MAIESLNQAQLTAAMQQLLSTPNFSTANPHLDAANKAAVSAGQWPNRPVFTPYALTWKFLTYIVDKIYHRFLVEPSEFTSDEKMTHCYPTTDQAQTYPLNF
jgi:hypothetical protein